MTTDQIKMAANMFIQDAKLTTWPQEAHVAFVAHVVKTMVAVHKGDYRAVAKDVLTTGQEHGALFANASAFRQWLQSDKVALLPKGEPSAAGNRYAKFLEDVVEDQKATIKRLAS